MPFFEVLEVDEYTPKGRSEQSGEKASADYTDYADEQETNDSPTQYFRDVAFLNLCNLRTH